MSELESSVPPPDESAAPAHAWFWPAFALCTLLTLLPLWAVEFLPGVDLPQHMAQIALWKQYDAGVAHDVYWLNWFTPYLFGYSLVRLLSAAMTIETAFRVVFSGYVLGLAFGMLAWLKALGRPRELALLAFPAAYGFSFQWGFFNYTCALPLALFFLAYGERHLRDPTRRSAAALAAFSVALFFGHVLVLTACGVLLACRAVVLRGFVRGFVAMLPAAAGALLAPPWILHVRSNHHGARNSDMWWEGLERVKQLPARMFGVEGDTWAIALAALLLVWLAVSIAVTPWRRHARFVVPCVALLLYFAIPSFAMDTFFLAPRFGIVFALALVPALAWPSGGRQHTAALAAVVVLVGSWNMWQLSRFQGFDAEMRGLAEVLAHAQPNRSLLGLTYDHGSRYFRGTPFVHAPAHYQARSGGAQIGFSFSVFFPQLVRFRDGKAPPMTPRLEWDPHSFSWQRDGGYDYFLVRSPGGEQTGKPFEGTRRRSVRLLAHSGDWWLYENTPRERRNDGLPRPRRIELDNVRSGSKLRR